MTRRFESLSAEEVLALAVGVERANAARFRTFADVFRGYDEAVAEKFAELATEEEAHEAMLVDKFHSRFHGPIPVIDEVEVTGVIESVDMDDPEHLIFDTLKERKVYELALRAEIGAQEFYRRAATATSDEDLAALYAELAGMEDEHRIWLQRKLEASGPCGGTP